MMGWQKLLKVPVPDIALLTYDLDEEIVRDAVKIVAKDYSNTTAYLGTFDLEANEGPIKGSTYDAKVALVNVLREITEENILPLMPKEHEIALSNGTLIANPKKTYEDLGLVIYPKKGANPVLWESLREQVKSDFKNDVDLGLPFVVTGLYDLKKDTNHEGKLRRILNEFSVVYNVPILTKGDGKFSSEDPELQKSGFPSKLGGGDRYLFTVTGSGVRGLYRGRNLVLRAGGVELACSDDSGRVHVVKNLGTFVK